MLTELALSQYMCAIAQAYQRASQVYGLTIEPSHEQPWVYDLNVWLHEDMSRKGVPIDQLIVEVGNTVVEMEGMWGPGADGLMDIPFDIVFTDPPQTDEDDFRL